MRNILKITIHSIGYDCFSANDFTGYKELDTENDARDFIKMHNFNISEIAESKDLGLRIFFLESLKYNDRLTEIKNLFAENLSREVNKYFELLDKQENQERKEQGYIRYKDIEEMTMEDYKGHLNKALTKDVLDYISDGVIFGYLGHWHRQLKHDEIIEKVFSDVTFKLKGEELDTYKILGNWLTSSDARHWMDSRDEDTLEEFENNLKEDINRILTLGFVYGLDEHGGTYRDTARLLKEYENLIEINC